MEPNDWFFKGSMYFTSLDLAKRSNYRRLTFGINPYGKATVSILTRIRLGVKSFIPMLLRTKKSKLYFEKYLAMQVARCRRRLNKTRTIQHNNSEHANLVQVVLQEKAVLDEISQTTGINYLN
ncbi:MAG: hypothetical protein HC836_31275 [Richelia sp. RM2_1_2]|nr:hypothetical protein [Richelia sp. RM2_1_2]